MYFRYVIFLPYIIFQIFLQVKEEDNVYFISSTQLLMYIFKAELHLKPKLSMFFTLSQIYQYFMTNKISIMKQIFWETQK